jgi:hypothetical protein
MTKVEKLEREIEALTAEERAQFREWYELYDAAEWDRQFEADADADKLDRLADAAIPDHRAGRSRRL